MDQKEIERQIMTRLTVPLWPTAGRALGLGRNATFQGAQTGEIETVKVGRRRPVGLTITLRSELVDFKGKPTPAIRVQAGRAPAPPTRAFPQTTRKPEPLARDMRPGPSLEAYADNMSDEIPF